MISPSFASQQQTARPMTRRGKHPGEEIAALPSGVELFHVEPLVVPGLGAERCLVWMRGAMGH
jgi:16S rRNA (guanine527-N7)-methyltransferase